MSNKKSAAPKAITAKRPRASKLTNAGIIATLKEEAQNYRITEVQKLYGDDWGKEVSKKYGLAPQDNKAETEKVARAYLRGEFDRIAREIGLDSAKLVEELDSKAVATVRPARVVATGPTTVKGKRLAEREAKNAQLVSPVVKSLVPDGALRKSTVKNPVERAWQLFDETKEMRRKDVIQKCLDEGIAFYTARTQYQVWKSAGKTN